MSGARDMTRQAVLLVSILSAMLGAGTAQAHGDHVRRLSPTTPGEVAHALSPCPDGPGGACHCTDPTALPRAEAPDAAADARPQMLGLRARRSHPIAPQRPLPTAVFFAFLQPRGPPLPA
jgi:hypothetical protein